MNQPNSWFVPKKYNQGGFDAVELVEDTKLRYYQITRAQQHPLKTEYMLSVLHAFNLLREAADLPPILSFDIVFVVPYVERGKLMTFTMPGEPILNQTHIFPTDPTRENNPILVLAPRILNMATYLRTGLRTMA